MNFWSDNQLISLIYKLIYIKKGIRNIGKLIYKTYIGKLIVNLLQ